jgi:diguanylate cyclase (GGDEF)-like protein
VSTEDPKPVVLLIDDDADVHRLVKARLRHEAVELQTASSGPEGLEHCRKSPPSAVLLDLDMPVMDGFSVLRSLKNDRITDNVPVIVISGMNDCGDKVTAFDLGAADYVVKPFDFAELRARLRAALRMNRLLKLLADRAELDGLTGLSNRASFDRRFAAEVAENERYGRPLTLAMLDIDFFKKVNDQFGHQGGDEVLTVFASLVQRMCRASDVPCRFGGEEFALILTETGPQDALVLLDRIRIALQDTVFPRHPEHRVTVSAGVAGFTASPSAGKGVAEWIAAADKALYAAKHGGRNRIVLAEGMGAAHGAVAAAA